MIKRDSQERDSDRDFQESCAERFNEVAPQPLSPICGQESWASRVRWRPMKPSHPAMNIGADSVTGGEI